MDNGYSPALTTWRLALHDFPTPGVVERARALLDEAVAHVDASDKWLAQVDRYPEDCEARDKCLDRVHHYQRQAWLALERAQLELVMELS